MQICVFYPFRVKEQNAKTFVQVNRLSDDDVDIDSNGVPDSWFYYLASPSNFYSFYVSFDSCCVLVS